MKIQTQKIENSLLLDFVTTVTQKKRWTFILVTLSGVQSTCGLTHNNVFCNTWKWNVARFLCNTATTAASRFLSKLHTGLPTIASRWPGMDSLDDGLISSFMTLHGTEHRLLARSHAQLMASTTKKGVVGERPNSPFIIYKHDILRWV